MHACMQDESSSAAGNTTLLLTIIFSLLIAVTCGLGTIVIIVFFGLR